MSTKLNVDALIQNGLTAHTLAVAQREAIERRLPAGLIDGLGASLTSLGAVVTAQKAAAQLSKASTKTQAASLETTSDLVSAIRVALAKAPREVRSAFGVGTKLDRTSPRSVAAAVQAIGAGWARHADAARGLGVVEDDITRLMRAAEASGTADRAQDEARAARPLATAARNAAVRSIEGAIERIAKAGILHHAHDGEARAAFEALIASTPKRPKKTPKAG